MAALTFALCAGATTIVRMNLDEMTKAAHIVARGKCVASEARVADGNIWTFTTFTVQETLKGSAAGQLTIRLPGGKVGHITSTVDAVPRFRPGEEAYLFLEPTMSGELSVTGWVQGTFRIERDDAGQEKVTQDTASIAVFDPATRKFQPNGLRNVPVGEFRRLVRDAVNRQKVSNP